jgi:hypothetical protein
VFFQFHAAFYHANRQAIQWMSSFRSNISSLMKNWMHLSESCILLTRYTSSIHWHLARVKPSWYRLAEVLNVATFLSKHYSIGSDNYIPNWELISTCDRPKKTLTLQICSTRMRKSINYIYNVKEPTKMCSRFFICLKTIKSYWQLNSHNPTIYAAPQSTLKPADQHRHRLSVYQRQIPVSVNAYS